MDFTTWICCKCGHKGNWTQIPGCEGYITLVLKKVQCEHPRCKKCDKLSVFPNEEDMEKEDEEQKKKKKGGLRAWFLRHG